MLVIAFIIASVKYNSSLAKTKNIALENGIDEEDYDILRFGLWFYIIPFLVITLFGATLSIIFLPLLILPFIPSVYYGIKISKKLDKGYDYVRKLGKTINQVVWIGFAGIGLMIFNWILLNINL